ncbi:MAG: putative chromosome-partitioning protein ParB [Elusimicrobia bacterium ADurb.Bin231]|nr:MAG: putative chromosome-partitioning protein ParB [Elusimicrobia bacterium ADurb.Bin231]
MRKALGKGLEALIPELGNALKSQPEGTLKLPIEKIKPNRYQPRENFDETAITELADSIATHGVVQPILVLPVDNEGFYEIVAGERRFRACQKAGLPEIPAIVKPASEQESFILSLIENLQRKDLNAIEEAVAYKRLIKEFNLKQEDVAQALGKKRSTIANTVRLLSLPDNVQNAVISGTISGGHARALAAIEDKEKQAFVLDQIINQQLTVRDVEKISQKQDKKVLDKDPDIVVAEEEMQRALGTKVEISYKGKKGKIIISCHSLEDLNRVIDQIIKK